MERRNPFRNLGLVLRSILGKAFFPAGAIDAVFLHDVRDKSNMVRHLVTGRFTGTEKLAKPVKSGFDSNTE